MDAAAQASPEKRLFISLITRDISLIDAIIDLTDNSVNAAMKPLRNSFASSKDFVSFFSKRESKPPCQISVLFDKKKVEVIDNASGIAFESARDEVFRFGHSESHSDSGDRLSVYGIGMKRALFKIGQRVSIVSDHEDGGFSLNLDVPSWAQDTKMPWTLPISSRRPMRLAE